MQETGLTVVSYPRFIRDFKVTLLLQDQHGTFYKFPLNIFVRCWLMASKRG